MNLDEINIYSQEEIEYFLDTANDNYHNKNEISMTDDEYDFVKEYLLSMYPKSKYSLKVGHKVPSDKKKVELPNGYWMGSMDKFKDEKSINIWIKKGFDNNFIISSKLDGISLMFYKKDSTIKLYTRGDGKYGLDVTHLYPYLNLPTTKDLSAYTDLVIRGELIIKEAVYQKLKSKSANSRSFTSGLVNSKTLNIPDIKKLDFVAYEIMYPTLKMSDQLKKIDKLGFNTVMYKKFKDINFEFLSNTLKNFKENSEYTIDGIIIRHDDVYSLNTSGNPDYAFAFKELSHEQTAEVKVIKVNWNVSKFGKLFPQVQYKPVKIGGIKLEFASGKSGEFISKNKIGPGAILKIAHSGDVIPDILKVIKPAKEADMPSTKYKWNETKVDIYSIDKNNNRDIEIKLITDFFKVLKVKNLGPGIVERLYDEGFNTVKSILKIKKSDLLEIEGFKDKLADKLLKNIKDALETTSLIDIMKASNIFGEGLGSKKIKLLFENIPNLMDKDANEDLIKNIIEVDGFSDKTAKQFVSKLDQFKKYLKDLNIKLGFVNDKVSYSKNIVFTGFRNNDLTEKLKKYNIGVMDKIDKNTILVVRKDQNSETSKVKDAKKKKIPVVTEEVFKNNFKTYVL